MVWYTAFRLNAPLSGDTLLSRGLLTRGARWSEVKWKPKYPCSDEKRAKIQPTLRSQLFGAIQTGTKIHAGVNRSRRP